VSELTIADVLALPALSEGVPEVLAGEDELGREIRWVHSGEFPDMPAVLKGGELLLTHGMTLSNREAGQRRYVADLVRAGLAGLVIELGAGMRRVPTALVDEARRRSLPLVVLHRAVPWVEITEAVHRTIVRRQADLLERGQALHDRFVAVLAHGAGVAEVLRSLADAIGNPVVLSHDDELVYSASRGQDHAAVASAWEAAARELSQAPPAVSMPVGVVDDPRWGVVTALALERPLDPFDRLALERAVPFLALGLLRAHEADTLAARDRGDFLDALIDRDRPLDEHRAHRRAARIGFDARASWLLPVAADVASGSGRLDERSWALVGRAVRTELASRRTAAVVGTLGRERHLALVAALTDPDARPAAARAIAEAIERTVRRTSPEAEVVVCVGRPAPSWSGAGEALLETVEALPAMRHAPARAWHDVSAPDLRRLMWALRSEKALTDFVEHLLAPLDAYDARRGAQLLETLEAFCAHGGRKAETARALGLERQSLYKRLARIEALLRASLDDEDTRLGLHLALRGRRLIGDARPADPSRA
jgi:PucR family transcriptional regulator, purine catabolism regulatory protein